MRHYSGGELQGDAVVDPEMILTCHGGDYREPSDGVLSLDC
jgi:hypothetical protein